jgi:prepilin peptidase CpaA
MSTAAAADALVLGVLVAGVGGAAAVDVASRRIPNAMVALTTGAGVVLAVTGASGVTWWSSLLGVVIGLTLMLPGHLFGATGAGDVKLFAAAGAVLGAAQIFEAFLFMAIAGGVFALTVAGARGRLAHTARQMARLFGRPREARAAIEAPAENNRFPYGPAIAVGCVLAAWV